jgi:S-(hydroxymethyl)glutathione dehydrogenase/alcohol dehydrogenase
MRAAVFHVPNEPLTIEDVRIAKPGRSQVLIRTAYTGLCHSDLHFIEGKYPGPTPAVLGHECAGVVEMVGEEVSYVRPGDHVITCLSVFCGYCENCLSGHMSICSTPEIRVPAGPSTALSWNGAPLNQILSLSGFAEQMLVHEHALVKIDSDMPMDRAALIGCAVITGYGAVVHAAQMEPGATVAVVGAGGIGLSAINSAYLAGAGRIFAVDIDPKKLEIARQFGATDVLDARDGNVPARIVEMTGRGVKYSFECVGAKQAAEDCFNMLRPGGTATVVGMIPFGTKIELHGFEFLRERRIQGTALGSNRFRTDMPQLIAFYKQGRLHLDKLIAGHLKLEQINEGLAALKKGGIARNLIQFDAL